MRKKRKLKRKVVHPDPLYNSVLISKLINIVMWEGKKKLARKIVYDSLEIVTQKTGKDPIEILNLALKNISPSVELKTRKIGGANYQIPVETPPERKETLALRWLVKFSRKRDELKIKDALSSEIIEASNNLGLAIKKKIETIKIAESNKAFAFYRM